MIALIFLTTFLTNCQTSSKPLCKKGIFFSKNTKKCSFKEKSPLITTTKRRSPKKGLLFGRDFNLIWPVKGRVTSHFGFRNNRIHDGIDIAAIKGTPIKAAYGGRVIFSGWKRGYGRVVVIDHRDFTTLYAHCNELLVSKDQWLRKGDTIATVGNSGISRGYHLHFEYRDPSGISYDPLEFFDKVPFYTSR